jgi:hypothetical protein
MNFIAGAGGVVEPVGHHATRVAFDRDARVLGDHRRRGHRIAAAMLLAGHLHPQGEELTGLVAEAV